MDAQKPRGLDPQERDIDVLRDLFESRVMTAAHVAAIHFDGKREAAKKRLQKLKAAGLIGERERKMYEPSVLFLTRAAFTILHNKGVLTSYPPFTIPLLEKRARVSDRTLAHELEVMDVKAAFHSTIKKTETFSVVEFSTWPLLHQFTAFRSGRGVKEVDVKPDGFIRIHEKEEGTKGFAHEFFLEVDRSTEKLDTLVTRAGCYMDYFRSGGFAKRQGAPRSAYKEYPFRVLMVCKTAERRNNIAERLLQNNPPIFTQVWLSTLDEVTANPLDAIWIRPLDYREATKGTPYDTERPRERRGYRRQTEREELAERLIKKSALLA